ncbi:hypothetical protein K0M31_010606 [Melipona bicolor]|uniref:Uncharacterized protein n=1 Tax=Melipona bicolor TaxID=60889 RepID=A0AA40FLH6_9HYME|nr:hypothetical protein K0M31_010606 [Melipona bicolor]
MLGSQGTRKRPSYGGKNFYLDKDALSRGTSSGDATWWPTEAGKSAIRNDLDDTASLPESSLLNPAIVVGSRDTHFEYSSVNLSSL